MSANDYAAILGTVAALIVAIGGLAVWREKKEPPPRPDERAQRIESTLQRLEGKIDILTDRIPR
jgi:hypothetical protein